jgi:hypothetical protein
MPPKRARYKEWQRDPSVPIPKRTLARLKKKADGNVIVAQADSDHDESDSFSREEDANSSNSSDDEHSQAIPTAIFDEELEQADLEPNGYFVSDSEFVCESESESSDSASDIEPDVCSNNDVIYPGASITVEDSILSIMKYAIRHKTTYSALSDLLGLVALHLPNNSKKDHLKSLYFLKKAFSSKLHKDEMVTVNEYCPDCSSPFDDDTKNACECCGRPKSKREKNYFLTLDIGEQIQNMFEGKLLL